VLSRKGGYKACKILKDQLQSSLRVGKQAEGTVKNAGSQNHTCLLGRLMVEELEEHMARQMIRTGEGGQALIEYVFILVLVAMVVIVVLLVFGPQLGNAFSTITHGL
jgi:Flp pilus assembly pilin Flp